MAKTEVIVVHETIAASIVKDVGSIAALTVGVLLGVYLESSALQWMAAFMWLFFGLARVSRIAQQHTFTIERARARLDEIEASFRAQ